MKKYKTYQKVLVILLPFASIALLWGFAYWFLSYETYPDCMLYKITGIYCPGCGGTRAVAELMKGNLLLSIRQNALVVVILVILFSLYIELFLKIVFGCRYKSPILNLKFLYCILIIFILYSVLRNFIPAIAPI